jgi:hypothetical protein
MGSDHVVINKQFTCFAGGICVFIGAMLCS